MTKRRWPGLRLPVLFALSAVLALIASGCTSKPQAGPSTSPPPATSPPPTGPSPTPSERTPLIAALPDGCDPQVPEDTATVAFVSGGRAWAAAPDGSGLVCLFDVADPGPFLWGPRGDRVALAGLALKGVGVSLDLPSKQVEPTSLSWGRPTGKAVVFTEENGPELEKVFLDSAPPSDISPLDSATYGDVAYHPSGLAVAFLATESNGASEIWMASNDGTSPKRLVFSNRGSTFGPIGFALDGVKLFYGAKHTDGTRELVAYDLSSNMGDQNLWVGGRDIINLIPPKGPTWPGALLDVGANCSDREALFSPLDGGPGTPLLTFPAAATTALGWLDEEHVLVGEGGCETPMNLWVTDVKSGDQQLLVGQVDRGAVRVPEPLPPPPLPQIGVDAGFA